MAIAFVGVRRVTHDEDARREAAFWASKTIAERVMAGWALAEDDLFARPQEADEPKERIGWTLRRVFREAR